MLLMKNGILTLVLLCSLSIFGQEGNCICCTEKYQEFDFWIGTWNVTTPDGKQAGVNIIDKCVLRENWTSAKGGYTGTSTNFYNAKEKQWEQIWVDNQGQSLHLKGGRVNNKMVLESNEVSDPEGNVFVNRITWIVNNDGTVRQLWETVSHKKTAKVIFDGLYVRKK